jgi:hypothetical protein
MEVWELRRMLGSPTSQEDISPMKGSVWRRSPMPLRGSTYNPEGPKKRKSVLFLIWVDLINWTIHIAIS